MRVSVNAQVLGWALDRSQRRENLEQKFPKLAEWLAGASPTFKQLQQFASAAAVPFGYLLLEAPPEEQLPIANYRTPNRQARTPIQPGTY